MPEILKEEYLDIYNRIQSEILSTTRFDRNSDLSTTYLGRVDITRASKTKVEETFPISEQGYTVVLFIAVWGQVSFMPCHVL